MQSNRWSSVHVDSLAAPLSAPVGYGGASLDFNRPSRSDEPFSMLLCCAFTGRHRMVERMVNEALSANRAPDVRWFLVGSSEQDALLIKALSERTGRVAGLTTENRPLGRKWQTCVHTAWRHFDSQLFGIVGSDDLVSRRLVDFIVDRHRSNAACGTRSEFMPAMYGTQEWLVCNLDHEHPLSPQVVRCNYDYKTAFQPLGAGRFYTKPFLDGCKGLIFASDKDKLLDDRGYFLVRDQKLPIEYYTIEDGPIVSVKGGWSQMNAIDDLLSADTLQVREYSFAAYPLLQSALSDASFRYLYRRPLLSSQLGFSDIDSGLLDVGHEAQASQKGSAAA